MPEEEGREDILGGGGKEAESNDKISTTEIIVVLMVVGAFWILSLIPIFGYPFAILVAGAAPVYAYLRGIKNPVYVWVASVFQAIPLVGELPESMIGLILGIVDHNHPGLINKILGIVGEFGGAWGKAAEIAGKVASVAGKAASAAGVAGKARSVGALADGGGTASGVAGGGRAGISKDSPEATPSEAPEQIQESGTPRAKDAGSMKDSLNADVLKTLQEGESPEQITYGDIQKQREQKEAESSVPEKPKKQDFSQKNISELKGLSAPQELDIAGRGRVMAKNKIGPAPQEQAGKKTGDGVELKGNNIDLRKN